MEDIDNLVEAVQNLSERVFDLESKPIHKVNTGDGLIASVVITLLLCITGSICFLAWVIWR
jgi:hypothetical protein